MGLAALFSAAFFSENSLRKEAWKPANRSSAALVKAAVLSAAVAVGALAASPAAAQTLRGSFGLSGLADLRGTPNPNPSGTSVRFLSINVDSATGDFEGLEFRRNKPSIKQLRLARTSPGVYSTRRVNNFVNFGRVDIGDQRGKLSFDLDPTTVRRNFQGSKSVVAFTPNGFSGKFEFKGETIGRGSFSASKAGRSEEYEMTLETVPEPITVLGTVAALGLLGVGKRELDKLEAAKSRKAE